MDLPSAKFEAEAVGIPLPERQLEARNCQYGAAFVAAKYCGMDGAPYRYPGEWQHGWAAPERNINPEFVVGSDGLSRHRRRTGSFWVARTDQADYLRTEGYAKVEAIGLPLVYLAKPEIPREPGSLLVMPAHSLSHTTHTWDFERYAEEVAALANHFSKVVACVYPGCFEKGYWVSAFRDCGIPVVCGAHISDRNSLMRMATLFSRFEFMTANGYGSNMVYAGLFGCKPSIYGTIARYRPEDFQRDTFWRNCQEFLPQFLELFDEANLRAAHPHLFACPWEAGDCSQWAAWQVGLQCRRSPQDLVKLFGWSAGHRFRRAIRTTAARARAGAKKAVQQILLPRTFNGFRGPRRSEH